jgi:hypothetical protein
MANIQKNAKGGWNYNKEAIEVIVDAYVFQRIWGGGDGSRLQT